ncbi:MAG: HepT-like ribonuclease domain-containing protein [Pyrinomonadaceae bacterium]|nr:DUF86 domain-containing protein [Blastocatellia bacterium]MDQ3219182.1 DUF86 domain-containing protein [Acidobacteriota bacterium]MDQ3489948.1 DUF86 domain-containing protein [Acidobacteriota bacterium]
MRDERLYLQDIRDAAGSIEQFLKHVSETDFLGSDLLQSAVIQKFLVIGEAASKISEGVKFRNSDIQWKKIIGIRNILVHVYFAVNWGLIWKTVSDDIPVLKERITSILQSEYPESDNERVE